MCAPTTTPARSSKTYIAGRGCLDILVNNAGFGLFGSIEETCLAEARAQLETNFWGAVRMIAIVLPRMRERHSGRIINISSVLGFMPVPFQGFYVASKHALEGYSEVLSLEVRPFGIHVVLIEPSSIRTAFVERHQDVNERLATYTSERDRVLAMMADRIHHGSHPKVVARAVLSAIRASNPHVRYTAGSGSGVLKVARAILPTSLFDKAVRKTFAMDQQLAAQSTPRALSTAASVSIFCTRCPFSRELNTWRQTLILKPTCLGRVCLANLLGPHVSWEGCQPCPRSSTRPSCTGCSIASPRISRIIPPKSTWRRFSSAIRSTRNGCRSWA
jgi:short-subunit dehydrogenase